jgi:hypothetical protein
MVCLPAGGITVPAGILVVDKGPKGSQIILERSMAGVSFGGNLFFQCAGFRLVPQVEKFSANGPGNLNDLMVQFELTNEAQALVVTRLLRIEMTQGKMRRQHIYIQAAWGLKCLTWLGSDVFVTRYFSKFSQLRTWIYSLIIRGRLTLVRSEPVDGK